MKTRIEKLNLETLGALEREREREREYLFIQHGICLLDHTSILNNEIIKFDIENKAELIAIFGGRF